MVLSACGSMQKEKPDSRTESADRIMSTETFNALTEE